MFYMYLHLALRNYKLSVSGLTNIWKQTFHVCVFVISKQLPWTFFFNFFSIFPPLIIPSKFWKVFQNIVQLFNDNVTLIYSSTKPNKALHVKLFWKNTLLIFYLYIEQCQGQVKFLVSLFFFNWMTKLKL